MKNLKSQWGKQMTETEKAIRDFCGHHADWWPSTTQVKEMLALAQPEKPKYRRGDRLICLETEDYCVIHISGTDRQWVKFPDSHIGVYTNEQVSELFELLPKEPQRKPLSDEEIYSVLENLQVMYNRPPTTDSRIIFARAIEAAHGIKEST